MNAARGMAIFIFIFIVIPWGLIFALRLVGHRRGYDSLCAPPQDLPLADRPLHCRLNLFHRWRSMHTPSGNRYRSAPTGLTLLSFHLEHPQPEVLTRALGALAAEVPVVPRPTP